MYTTLSRMYTTLSSILDTKIYLHSLDRQNWIGVVIEIVSFMMCYIKHEKEK